ncbi:MAG TPA: YdhR family protein [Acidimicrobiales bacterium]|nr:YdhR family protein [Acidimicrobiales bacterium]
MHIQLVTYRLNGISEDQYLDMATTVASRFSSMPGLQAKMWLDGGDGDRFGAVYVWDDQESMDRYCRSDLFEATSDEFTAVESQGFTVLKNLTRLTQPVLDLLPPTTPRQGSPILGREPAEGSPDIEVRGGQATTPMAKKPARAKAKAKPAKG